MMLKNEPVIAEDLKKQDIRKLRKAGIAMDLNAFAAPLPTRARKT